MKHFLFSILLICSAFLSASENVPSKIIGGNASDVIELPSNIAGGNTFIITEGGKFRFEIPSKYSPSKAMVLWNENGENDITDVSLSDGYLFFSKPSFTPGNALISILDENDEILWSWLIWSTDRPHYYFKNYSCYLFLDRNIGATSTDPTSADSFGLLFNPGNPFPFPGPKYQNFVITETPSVPEGWYVAPGYGFYKSNKKPSPKLPMLLCTDDDKFGNTYYFSPGYNQCSDIGFTPTCAEFLQFITNEPVVDQYALIDPSGFVLPCVFPEQVSQGNGMYLCKGIYNSMAVDTDVLFFYDEMAKLRYCEGAALLPIRPMAFPWNLKYSFSKNELPLKRGDEHHLEYTVFPPVHNLEVSWESTNPEIVSVDNDGNIKCISEGTAIISIWYASDFCASVAITVTSDSGIAPVECTNTLPELFITPSGLISNSPSRGLNIVKYSDGIYKKSLIK